MFKSRKNQCSYIIFLALFLFFNPILVLAQTGSVTLSMKNATLKQFFEAVEKQTTYIFSYRDAIVEGKKEVTLNVTNQPIRRLLDDVLHQRDLQYTMTGHSIVVTLKTAGNVKLVSGTVVDSNGEPIIGANVVEKGTTNGTVTDISGNFSLNINDSGILQVSYIGFNTQDVAVNGKSSLMINLKEDTQKLDEVVVVGYGVQKKSNVTGSVASIKTDDFNDIESIEILKDAASTAIYGARGAGGVILVTTKKGKIGKLSINARVNFGIETPIDLPDMLHTADFIDRKLAAGFPNNPNSGWDNPASLPDTDWEDLVWRNAFRQNYFL